MTKVTMRIRRTSSRQKSWGYSLESLSQFPFWLLIMGENYKTKAGSRRAGRKMAKKIGVEIASCTGPFISRAGRGL